MTPRKLLPLLSLLALLGLGLALLNGGAPEADPEGSGAGHEGTEDLPGPQLTVQERPATLGPLEGKAISRVGLPVGGARLYLLSKNPATPRPSVAKPAGKAGEDGRWSLGTVDPVGHWVVLLDDRHLPLHVDGDAWNGKPLKLQLEPGREIFVDLEYGHPGDSVGIELAMLAPPDVLAHAVPRPDERLTFERRSWSRNVNRLSLRVPTKGSVLVQVLTNRRRVMPRERLLSADEQRARFRLERTCGIQVTVLEAGSRRAPIGPVSVRFFDAATGEPASAEMDAMTAFAWACTDGLRPGSYDVRVEAEAYVPQQKSGVRLVPGDWIDWEVLLEPAPTAATIDFDVELPAGWHDMWRGFFAMGRRGDRWWPLEPQDVDREAGRFSLAPLPPGRWEFVIWAGPDWVGRATVDAPGGRRERCSVRVGKGTLVPLVEERPKNSFYSEWAGMRIDVELTPKDGWGLPLVWFRPNQKRCWWDPGENLFGAHGAQHGASVPQGAILGPYPFEDIAVKMPGKSANLGGGG